MGRQCLRESQFKDEGGCTQRRGSNPWIDLNSSDVRAILPFEIKELSPSCAGYGLRITPSCAGYNRA